MLPFTTMRYSLITFLQPQLLSILQYQMPKSQYQQYLNFPHPIIHQNFDPKACGWAFGMNIFDLKEWRLHNLTQTYHYWQDLNEERQLWKLGSLPPGLLTFYKLAYPLDQRWHLLKLGYKGSIKQGDIDRAAVIHYNGIYKPWLDIAYSRYVPYWSKYAHCPSVYFPPLHQEAYYSLNL
ncbi:Plant galacturonosyltransferase GAUT protein [Dioscorea alata]|uniref:Plant galacturonosyltransferase GAUT protein n=1 Tax=Dioscorea alata TaxID=55571 RepID=A0ACB7V7C2_DIOAL|nr:Plant galacturonosyltransferase GAUT protein [Dioscorea alata]